MLHDGQTDRKRGGCHIEVGAPPKNNKGPKTEPCGIPGRISVHFDVHPLTEGLQSKDLYILYVMESSCKVQESPGKKLE